MKSLLHIGISGILFTLTTTPVFGQNAQASACFQPPAALASTDIAAFVGSPSQLLTAYPAGGIDMANRVRGLAGSSSSTVSPLLSLAATATVEQRAAIGAGLARAAAACVARDPEYAALIQQQVALAGLSDLETAFLAASGDVATAALGGAAAAGAGASQAGGITGNGSAQGGTAGANGDTSVPTATLSFASRSARSFTSNSGGQFFSIVINAVSPN